MSKDDKPDHVVKPKQPKWLGMKPGLSEKPEAGVSVYASGHPGYITPHSPQVAEHLAAVAGTVHEAVIKPTLSKTDKTRGNS